MLLRKVCSRPRIRHLGPGPFCRFDSLFNSLRCCSCLCAEAGESRDPTIKSEVGSMSRSDSHVIVSESESASIAGENGSAGGRSVTEGGENGALSCKSGESSSCSEEESASLGYAALGSGLVDSLSEEAGDTSPKFGTSGKFCRSPSEVASDTTINCTKRTVVHPSPNKCNVRI